MISNGDGDIDEVIGQLKSMIDSKIQKKREEAVIALNSAVADVQALVNAAKAVNRQEIEAYRDEAQQAINDARQAHDLVHEQVVEAVTDLNRSLGAIKEAHNAVKDQIQLIEIGTYQAIEESRTSEQEFLRDLKSFVEAEALNVESALAQRSLQDNSAMEKISSIIARRLEGETV